MAFLTVTGRDQWSSNRSRRWLYHFSTAQQAQDTADKHFANVENLFLAAVETDTLDSAIKWEVSRGGAEFPHLYDRLKLSDVVWCQPLLLMDGRHKFPEGLT